MDRAVWIGSMIFVGLLVVLSLTPTETIMGVWHYGLLDSLLMVPFYILLGPFAVPALVLLVVVGKGWQAARRRATRRNRG